MSLGIRARQLTEFESASGRHPGDGTQVRDGESRDRIGELNEPFASDRNRLAFLLGIDAALELDFEAALQIPSAEHVNMRLI